jgi:hypothetical protein
LNKRAGECSEEEVSIIPYYNFYNGWIFIYMSQDE